MGIIKFLKWLADDDPIKEQKSMVDAAKFEVERLKRNIEDVKRGSNSASTLKELRQKLKDKPWENSKIRLKDRSDVIQGSLFPT